ncbi:WD40 repeat-like protein [Amylocystis lapponica]|nr:WD40 repeat-like protein [Amylocystis lapponica]
MDPQLCVTPRRKRTWAPGSITNAYSSKRRRISMASVDWGRELAPEAEPTTVSDHTTADRFISARQEFALPLNTTPRTNRIARVFGLADERVLKYGESSGTSDSSDLHLHRLNFSQLLAAAPKVSPTSAAAHVGTRKQFILALDGPGIPADPFAYPLSWSSLNAIAVACGREVYYQNLDTRIISHLCSLPRNYGRLSSIEWARDKPQILAAGTTSGLVQLWDAETATATREWRDEVDSIGGMNWNGGVLAVGSSGGDVALYDTREPEAVSRLTLHKVMVHGVRWSHDGNYLATGDQRGVVHFWDARAGKELTNERKKGSKMKHTAPVKALGWCPWKPDLLASGSTYPDGKIRIWSINSTSSTSAPLHTISLNTSVTSLIWSPHCKELLSTHGTSWVPRAASTSALSSSSSANQARPQPVKSPLTNSLVVHAYPSLRRLVTVQAHSGAVGHSCLGPDGTLVFTICPAEEAMKMWKVWGLPRTVERRESVFDKCGIR